jgi:membrane protease YdiL (CAAX protease family)
VQFEQPDFGPGDSRKPQAEDRRDTSSAPRNLNFHDLRRVPERSSLKFFVLVFALAIPFWVLGGLVKPPQDFPIKLPLSALQLVCPLAAALVLVHREAGGAGIRTLLGGVFSYRKIKPIWYVPIIGLMPAIYALAYEVQRLLGQSLPNFEFSLVTTVTLFVVFFISAGAEEVGWTGYAFDPLQARWGAAGAAILLGLVWALFHFVADLQAGHDLGWIAWHRFGAVGLRVLIAWAYNNTAASVLAAVLVHAMDNVSWQLTPINGSHYDPAVTAPITWLVASTVAFVWRPRTLANFRFGKV